MDVIGHFVTIGRFDHFPNVRRTIVFAIVRPAFAGVLVPFPGFGGASFHSTL